MRMSTYARLVHLMLPLVESQLRILGPGEVVNEFSNTQGVIYGSTAPFGAPAYGDRILGGLILGADDCGTWANTHKKQIESENTHGGEKIHDVVVMRRSTKNCSFVRQVLVAQEHGAGAVLIVDHEIPTKTREQLVEEVVPNDGNGDKIKIPSMLIGYSDGSKLLDKLYDKLKETQQVANEAAISTTLSSFRKPTTEVLRTPSIVVEMSWDVPQAGFVIADFWMSSGSRESQQFLKQFKQSATTLAYHLDFIPHYHVWAPQSLGELGDMCSMSKDPNPEVGNTWHCAPDPDGIGPITGADVLKEDVRQLCLWYLTSARHPKIGGKYSAPFWEYVSRFPDECPLQSENPMTRFGESCSYNLMSSVLKGSDVNLDKLHNCTKESAANFLDEQVKRVAWSPQALRINGWRYRGALDPQTVDRAVCAGFSSHLAECDELLSTNMIHRNMLVAKRTTEYYFGDSAIFLVITAIIILSGMNMYLYRRSINKMITSSVRDEVMQEVRSQMSRSQHNDSYLKL